jgi:single-strand DNA-binding protein
MNESFVTVVGNLVGDPQHRSTKLGKPFASFRVASTTRRWDAGARRFVDGSTNFVNVVAFNALGGNIMSSLKKGEPVVVYGRLRVNQWVNGDGLNMTSVEVDAYSVGHDLNRGQTAFARSERIQYESNDRLADPNIQASLDGADRGGADEDGVLPDEIEADDEGMAVDAGDGPVERGGLHRTTQDADTDEYVVARAG